MINGYARVSTDAPHLKRRTKNDETLRSIGRSYDVRAQMISRLWILRGREMATLSK